VIWHNPVVTGGRAVVSSRCRSSISPLFFSSSFFIFFFHDNEVGGGAVVMAEVFPVR